MSSLLGPADPPAPLTPPEPPPGWRAATRLLFRLPPSRPAHTSGDTSSVAVAWRPEPSASLSPPLLPTAAASASQGHVHPERSRGLGRPTPARSRSFLLPFAWGPQLAACERRPFVLDTGAVCNQRASATDERLWKGFFRLSKNSCLVTVRHLLLLARGTHARLRELGLLGGVDSPLARPTMAPVGLADPGYRGRVGRPGHHPPVPAQSPFEAGAAGPERGWGPECVPRELKPHLSPKLC